MGEKCTATILPGAIAALEQIAAWGVGNIAATLSFVNTKIANHLEHLGFQLPTLEHRSPHMFGAELPAGYSQNIVAELKARSVFFSQRGTALRFAPHWHVTGSDLGRLL